MSIRLTSNRLLNGLGPQRTVGNSRSDLTLVGPMNRVDDSPDLSAAQLAALRLALEFDFGPDLSGIRVYVGSKAGPTGTNTFRDH
jgi:hypothetical protein